MASVIVVVLAANLTAKAGTGRLVKVLPEFLDLKGRNSLAPSLFERDFYQVSLREHPNRRSGIRFYVQWKTKGGVWEPLRARVELRGITEGNLPRQLVVEEPVANPGGDYSHWTAITLAGEDYKKFGAITAWRVTFWEGRTLLDKQQSFLW